MRHIDTDADISNAGVIIIIIIMIRQFIRRRNMSMKSLQGRCTPGSRDGRRPLDQAHRLSWAIGPPLGSYETTSTIAIIITQPGSWYSFFHPTEGRRLSQPTHSCILLLLISAITGGLVYFSVVSLKYINFLKKMIYLLGVCWFHATVTTDVSSSDWRNYLLIWLRNYPLHSW